MKLRELDENTIHKIQAARGGHVIFAPSGSAMWSSCPGSLIPNLMSEDTAGMDAAEGTVGHEIAEQWLTSGKRPTHLLGTIITIQEKYEAFDIEVTWEMLDYVEEYVRWCEVLPGEHYVETRVDFSDLTPIPHQSGTADHAVCFERSLTVSDLKFGKGVQVWAENNTQLLLYAYGFFRKFDDQYHFETITLRIGQPRLQHFDETTITRQQLLDFASWISARAHDAWRLDAPRHPSLKGCQWCNIKSGCSALATLFLRILDGDVEGLDAFISADDMEDTILTIEQSNELSAIDIDQLSVAQKAKIYRYRKLMDKFFNEIHDDLQARVEHGEIVEGCKLVQGRVSRDFISEQKTLEHFDFLGVDTASLYERKLLSPAKSEEVLRKVGYSRKIIPILLAPVVRKTEGRPTLALDTDRRKALQSVDAGVFDDDEL